MSRRYREAEFLREQYVEQRRSQQEIAEECGVSQGTIQYWIRRHGIERQPRYKDEDWLREQYVEKRRTRDELAEECDVSASTISRWLNRLDIERQPRYKSHNWLYEQYVEQRRNQRDIAEECGVAKTTICHWLSRHGITDGESMVAAECGFCGDSFRYYPSVRDGQFCSNECSNARRSKQIETICEGCGETFQRRETLDVDYCSMSCWGEDYRVDTSGYYSACWKQMRAKALERDDHECVVCGISDDEHRHRFRRGLDVHHLVPVRSFKQWDKPPEHAHVLRNLITVCRTHHPDALGTTVEPKGNCENIPFEDLPKPE